MFAKQYDKDKKNNNGFIGKPIARLEHNGEEYKNYNAYRHDLFYLKLHEANCYCIWDNDKYARITKILEHSITGYLYIEMRPFENIEEFYANNIPFLSSDVKIVKVNRTNELPPTIKKFDIQKFRKCFPMLLGADEILLGGYLHDLL